MKKKAILFVSAIALTLILTGCGSNGGVETVEQSGGNKASYTFDNLKEDLTALDSNIEINDKSAELVGATEGYGYMMDGCTIEVYKYDKTSDQYKTAEKEQKISMPSFGMSYNATVKNGYAYMVLDGSCDSAIEFVSKLN